MATSPRQSIVLHFDSRAERKTASRALNAVGVTLGGEEFCLHIKYEDFKRYISLPCSIAKIIPKAGSDGGPLDRGGDGVREQIHEVGFTRVK